MVKTGGLIQVSEYRFVLNRFVSSAYRKNNHACKAWTNILYNFWKNFLIRFDLKKWFSLIWPSPVCFDFSQNDFIKIKPPGSKKYNVYFYMRSFNMSFIFVKIQT